MKTPIERITGYACEVDRSQWEELVRVAKSLGVKIFSELWPTKQDRLFVSLHEDGDIVKDWTVFNDLTLIPFPDFLSKLKGEDTWVPKNGEEVEVSGNGRDWYVRIFVVHHRGTYHCEMESDNSLLSTWKFCQPLRPTITRTEAEALLNKRIID